MFEVKKTREKTRDFPVNRGYITLFKNDLVSASFEMLYKSWSCTFLSNNEPMYLFKEKIHVSKPTNVCLSHFSCMYMYSMSESDENLRKR